MKSDHATGLPEVAKEVVREPTPNADTVFQLVSHPVQDQEANTYSHGVDCLTACAEEYNLASLPKCYKSMRPSYLTSSLLFYLVTQ